MHSMAVLLLLPLLASFAQAQDTVPGDQDPFASLAALEEGELATLRGGTVLPDGLTLEVTGLMRVLVDGAELAQSTLPQPASVLPVGAGAPSPLLTDAPLLIQNALNGVNLEHYREINFRISNLPISLGAGRFLPAPVGAASLIP